jgi:hypothetical protein
VTPARNPHRTLRRVLAAAPPVLAKYFRPDCCIGATRIAIDVLAGFGVDAVPMPCEVLVFNPAYRANVEAGRRAKDVGEMEAFGDGSWTVGVGFGEDPRPGCWPGHLVAGVPSLGLVLDLTITQADRPARGIVLEPLLVAPSPAAVDGRGYCWFDVNGCAVGYRFLRAAPDWRGSRDWCDAGRSRKPAAEIAAAVRRGAPTTGRRTNRDAGTFKTR